MVIGETILGAVLNVVFDKLASQQVLDFLIKSSKLDQSLIDKLKDLMLMAGKLLDDAEQKQITDKAVKKWLSDLKHLFYRAEEIVDEISTEALRSSMNFPTETESFGTKVRNLIPAFSSSSSCVKNFSLEIREVVTRLDHMVSRSNVLGLREGSGWRVSERLPTSYLLEDTGVFGRDQEKQQLLEFLLSEEAEGNRIGVAAIVGMGGLGKTTLAKMVYNDDSLGSFDLKAWVYVSDHFDVSRVTKSILECITHQAYSGSLELSVLQYELSEMLKEKRLLLVLDDVWNEKYQDWECLRAPLTYGASGSKVIVTTRNFGVASVMDTAPVIHLNPLSDEDGLLLFSKHVFGVGNLSPSRRIEFLGIGRNIVHKCKGLPLAIKTLGRLLRSEEDIKEWEAILESSVWDLPDNKSNVVPALRLSYDHLPSHLKRCFGYCAIFPKGHRFDRKRLVLLWMAENFVQPTESRRRIEDIGEEYLCQLSSWSFFETTDTGEFLMHDLMHDLALDISGEFLVRSENKETPEISEKARYFSFCSELFNCNTMIAHLLALKYVRTFYQLPLPLPFWTSHSEMRAVVGFVEWRDLNNVIPAAAIAQLNCLRVLSLSDRYTVVRLPDSIGYLKQLRFLDVSYTGIKELPESVCSLYHLQTLLLFQCKSLEQLPENMFALVSLRHLDISGTSSLRQMPQQMHKLSSLQTLTDFVVSKHGGASIKEIRELRQIRGKFALRGLQNVSSPDDALYVNLSNREYLNELALEFDCKDSDDSENCRALLENLKPHVNLEKLTIVNYLSTRFPNWLGTECWIYTKIDYLCLTGCQYCCSLPSLGRLPSLRELVIMGMDYIMSIGSEFYGYDSAGLSNPFPVLRSLVFREMKSWVVWSGHEIEGRGLPFPCLETLSLDNCPKFKGELPVHLPSLKSLTLDKLALFVSLPPEIGTLSFLGKLSIQNCPNLVSLNNIKLPPNIRCLSIKKCEVLKSLPEAMFHLTHLRELSIIGCPCLSSTDKDTLPTSLEKLEIESCEAWQFVLFDICNTSKMPQQHYGSLVFIRIKNIGNALVSFPLGAFPNLRELKFSNCEDLEAVHIPRGIDLISLTSLQELSVYNSPKLKYIGKTEERGVVDLPAPNLRHLAIWSCDILKPLNGIREGLPSNLETLIIDVSEKITSRSIAWSLVMFSSLRVLAIGDHFAECFPDTGTLPISITRLRLMDFPNLKLLDGKALKSLTSIHELAIDGCPILQCLPEEGLPPSLDHLHIWRCPLLEARCQRDKGLDWHMINHFPCVKINDIWI